LSDIIVVVVILIVVWYWWDTIGAKEIARLVGKKACDDADLQFLDDTVAKQKIWLQRNNQGRLIICRHYYFEFATHGDTRYKGKIVLLGKSVDEIQMDVYKI